MVSKREQRINEVLRKQRNADRKVSRNESKGIRIRRTDENPHVSPAEIRGYSASQLRAHERRLDAFTSRSNQYEPGQNRQAIRRSSVHEYRRLEAENNARAERLEASIRNTRVGNADTTVGTLLAQRERLNQRMNQQQRLMQSITRDISSINGQKGIEAAIQGMRQRLTPGYARDYLEKRMNSIRAALTYSGNSDLLVRVNDLTLEQQQILVDYSNFGDIAALNIESGKYDSDGTVRDDWDEDFNGVDTQDNEELHNNLVDVLNRVKKTNIKAASENPKRLRGPR